MASPTDFFSDMGMAQTTSTVKVGYGRMRVVKTSGVQPIV